MRSQALTIDERRLLQLLVRRYTFFDPERICACGSRRANENLRHSRSPELVGAPLGKKREGWASQKCSDENLE